MREIITLFFALAKSPFEGRFRGAFNIMSTFQEIINSDTPVLVDFYATWCGPCKAMAPAIEAIGKEVQGKARVLKIDVDRNQAVAAKYQIQSVPTLMIFKNGNIVWKQSGGMDKSSLKSILLSYV